MNRQIVMDTGCLHRYGKTEEILKLIKEAGFTCYDMTLFWKGTTEQIGVGPDWQENAKKLRACADSLGLKCEQTHSYFTNGLDEETSNRRIDYIKKDLITSKILGAKVVVIHPILGLTAEQNIEFFKLFIPLAHELDIKIAIENVWDVIDGKISPCCTSRPQDLLKIIDTLNDDHVCVCLDIGHAEMEGCQTSAVEMINVLGPRIQALHIHDNDLVHDDHQVPYSSKIPFSLILKALKENNYQGNITFEVETCYSKGSYPDAQLPLELFPAFIKLEYEIGKYFANYLDK